MLILQEKKSRRYFCLHTLTQLCTSCKNGCSIVNYLKCQTQHKFPLAHPAASSLTLRPTAPYLPAHSPAVCCESGAPILHPGQSHKNKTPPETCCAKASRAPAVSFKRALLTFPAACTFGDFTDRVAHTKKERSAPQYETAMHGPEHTTP